MSFEKIVNSISMYQKYFYKNLKMLILTFATRFVASSFLMIIMKTEVSIISDSSCHVKNTHELTVLPQFLRQIILIN